MARKNRSTPRVEPPRIPQPVNNPLALAAQPKIPSIVMSLAEKVGMTPVAWNIQPDHVTIVFQQGPKLRFERE